MSKYIFLSFILFCSCSIQSPEQETRGQNTIEDQVSIDSLRRDSLIGAYQSIEGAVSYEQILADVGSIKNNLQNTEISIDSISKIFTSTLTRQIIPYWYGTPWDFDGYSNVPNKGTIACGYFVSTTLKHTGFNLNRYQLAQQTPFNEALSLSQGGAVIEIYEEDKSERINTILDTIADGIHFVGFNQNHVGYLYKGQNDLFVIHSNYLGNIEVSIEDARYSPVFGSFSKLYIVELSNNATFLNSWVKGLEIDVVKE